MEAVRENPFPALTKLSGTKWVWRLVACLGTIFFLAALTVFGWEFFETQLITAHEGFLDLHCLAPTVASFTSGFVRIPM